MKLYEVFSKGGPETTTSFASPNIHHVNIQVHKTSRHKTQEITLYYDLSLIFPASMDKYLNI